MDWARHSGTWPHAAHSRFVLCKPHRWHIQEMGDGPLVLLIHGAGGATQSWRHLMPLLAQKYRVVAMDLPGQGFTKCGAGQRLGLVPMAQDLLALCRDQGWAPAALIGHSAGGAVALEMTRHMAPAPPVIGINAALGNFKGLAGILFPLIAKALAMTPWFARLFTASASNPQSVTRLIEGTGSRLPEDDLKWYRALVNDSDHVNGTLGMMAQWNLDPLLAYAPQHAGDVLFVTGDLDKSVPPKTSIDFTSKMKGATAISLPGYGHLVHEEAAEAVFEAIAPFLTSRTRLVD